MHSQITIISHKFLVNLAFTPVMTDDKLALKKKFNYVCWTDMTCAVLIALERKNLFLLESAYFCKKGHGSLFVALIGDGCTL